VKNSPPFTPTHSYPVRTYNTVIAGSGAAGINCAVHLCEFMRDKGISDPEKRIAVVTGGLGLGASRMSGSDKQTYYKLNTAATGSDSAAEFAHTLTAAGCCHGDLAVAEAACSAREFYHLVQAGVPFPHDHLGGFFGYKTDHDPRGRATSAGPKTSRFMCERLQEQLNRYKVPVFDNMEVAELISTGQGRDRRTIGLAAIDKNERADERPIVNVFLCRNLVLAAGGPGELYETSVYPRRQWGIHGIALKAGLIAENLTESQFGLASTKFRWNVSGTYMQAIPRVFSAGPEGGQHDFLDGFFGSKGRLASAIFLKGYQWPFDPQKIAGGGSSLIDILVSNETGRGRRVFLDFLNNPAKSRFDVDSLDPEAAAYIKAAGAVKTLPIERLAYMNQPAVDIYKENGIDLYREPLEIAVCAQHNNGGFAVDTWWRSNVPGVFVIGEMAGTHGVKRPGGSALNAGQVGGLRAAEYIANTSDLETPDYSKQKTAVDGQVGALLADLARKGNIDPKEAIWQTKHRMTTAAAHIRSLETARNALGETVGLYRRITAEGFRKGPGIRAVDAVRAGHLALAGAAYLKAIVELLEAGGGSRGSYIVLSESGVGIHHNVKDETSRKPLRFRPENKTLRNSILQLWYDPAQPHLFSCRTVAPRRAEIPGESFEIAWKRFRDGTIFR